MPKQSWLSLFSANSFRTFCSRFAALLGTGFDPKSTKPAGRQEIKAQKSFPRNPPALPGFVPACPLYSFE